MRQNPGLAVAVVLAVGSAANVVLAQPYDQVASIDGVEVLRRR
ncbi:hypothetical protein [Nocardioides acrostichi]|nr:hypothetical protein [Nocardioides acrostichi]